MLNYDECLHKNTSKLLHDEDMLILDVYDDEALAVIEKSHNGGDNLCIPK